MMFPKAVIVRSKAYLRLVASLPCINCGLHDYSQAAHVPASGKGMKESDFSTFPLCCNRPGVNGCHQNFDLYAMFPDSQETREVGSRWASETRALLNLMGLFPTNLQKGDA